MTLPALKVSDDRRHLITSDGRPFFYLGDTAWDLFHRLDRDDAEVYLTDRAAKGFNVIQAVVLAEADGLRVPNAHGDLPLRDLSPEQPNEPYFRHVDWIVERAASLGMVTAMLPTWGDKWNQKWGTGPEVFTPRNAEVFGEWLGRRYHERPIIWMLGGDRSPETPEHVAIIRAMAAGLRRGDGGAHLITFHPSGEKGSAEFFHDEPWLDFNVRQNSHSADFAPYAATRADASRTPVKPVIDAEPVYEDIPIGLKTENPTYSNAADVRRAFYWDVLSGACGHTYGHHSIWQFFEEGRTPKFAPVMSWKEALLQPGAFHVGHGRRLIESRPLAGRQPDDALLVTSPLVSGNARARCVAVRGADGAYAMVYVPEGRAIEVRLDRISGTAVNAWRFDPRTGVAVRLGTYPPGAIQRFAPPVRGEAVDWVLVLDDASRNWPAPGSAAVEA